MANDAAPAPANGGNEPKLKIYFLPNLLTAGNLFCGFVALTKIVEASPDDPDFTKTIRVALFYILLACICDLLDGRVARLGGYESPFGREFDSLADIVSFGVAPAFLVHRIVLADVFHAYPKLGWFIASIYLICGAFRLARFNCIADKPGGGGGTEFLGFPIPSAAGMVASLTLFLLWAEDHNYTKFRESIWRFSLPVLLVFLSLMMVSTVKYPTFKKLDFRATRTFPKMVAIVLVGGLFFILWDKLLQFVLPAFFTVYLIYGFVRPFISRRMRHDIEDEDDEDEAAAAK
ncbi:MAG: CDP-diacylglycerol--serine O-phosphatidyltransferase [Verrucomicrobia bacterium]|nr:MAG: CDP-diacylglycerol--serine O-phosphatidyltransferase [Verrucomicrobiota bacterium]